MVVEASENTLVFVFVGQVSNLRDAFQAALRARPRKRFGCRHESSLDRIPFDVPHNIPKLSITPNEPVITLVLPERLPHDTQQLIPFPPGVPLQRPRDRRHAHQRRDQKMDVVRHDGICVELVLAPVLIPNRLNNHFCHFWSFEVQRASSGRVKLPIHGDKGLTRRSRRWERSICRETSVQTPRQEDRLASGVKMWQSTTVKDRHRQGVESGGDCSLLEGMGRLEIGPQVANLPH